MVPIETFYISSKAHTISNKLVSKVFAQKKGGGGGGGGEVMTATNMCSNFGGIRCRPPLSFHLYTNRELHSSLTSVLHGGPSQKQQASYKLHIRSFTLGPKFVGLLLYESHYSTSCGLLDTCAISPL